MLYKKGLGKVLSNIITFEPRRKEMKENVISTSTQQEKRDHSPIEVLKTLLNNFIKKE